MANLLTKLIVKTIDAKKKVPVELKLLNRRELRSVLKLFYQEGWIDFTLSDLEYMYRVSPKTCFKFVANDEMIGVTFALLFDNGVCYPSSNIISEAHRKKVKYHNEVIKYSDYLKDIAQVEVMYSTKWLVDLYTDVLKYKAIGEIHRFKLKSNKQSIQHNLEQLNEENLANVAQFLSTVYSCERTSLLSHALKHNFVTRISKDDNGNIDGFAMLRSLPKYEQLGPVVSSSSKVATKLINTLVGDHNSIHNNQERDIIIDGEKEHLTHILSNSGVTFEKEGTEMVKMIRGDESLKEDDEQIFAIYSHYLS